MSDATHETPADEQETPVDGRTARAMRTRDAIVAACIALVDAGDLKPTAPRIADKAGVSVRSVFQHFDDLETLFAMVADEVISDLSTRFVPTDATLPLPARIDHFVGLRCSSMEAVSPIRRSAALYAPFSPEIKKRFEGTRDLLRQEIRRVFADQFEAAPMADREQLVDVLEVILTWHTWETLRTRCGRSVDDAAAVVGRMLTMTFACI